MYIKILELYSFEINKMMNNSIILQIDNRTKSIKIYIKEITLNY